MPVIIINNDEQFRNKLATSGTNLVVVDFTAAWCGPCRIISPHFEELSNRYSNDAIFIKIDVDQCPEAARRHGVSSMPTFVFFRNLLEVGRTSGANASALETKLKEQIALNPVRAESGVPGHLNLIPTMILESRCECLNSNDDHPLKNCLTSDSSYLESDVDEQLIILFEFSQSVKLHSIAIKGPADKGVKYIRLFINQPQTLDFDQVSSRESVQDLEFNAEQITEGKLVPLKYVKFQNVQNILIFVQNNLEGAETTVIEQIKLIGAPIATTDMGALKRVAGKQSERH